MVNIFSVILGGVLVWVGGYLSDRRRTSNETKIFLRQAYVRWYTSLKDLGRTINAMSSVVSEIPDMTERYETANRYMADLRPALAEILKSSTEIYVSEPNQQRRELLLATTSTLEDFIDLAQNWTLHHDVHVGAMKRFDAGLNRWSDPSLQLTRKQREEGLRKAEALRVELREWDQNCKFHNPDDLKRISSSVVEILKTTERLFQKQLGGSL